MAFLAVTLSFPLILLGLAEIALRVFDADGGDPLFIQTTVGDREMFIANPAVGARWFGGEAAPPAPRGDPFLVDKPANGVRVFVLGESTTYGFPHPPTVAFPRMLEDVLRDVLPGAVVEVVNLGIPATNSWTMRDIAGDVLARQPDVVLIQAGHNEYYGALGVGSAIGGSSPPLVIRTTLALQRLRTVAAVRDIVRGVRRSSGATPWAGAGGSESSATFMETIVGDQAIELDGETYRAGLAQFESNLSAVVRRFRDAGVPVVVGSLTSNLRDQPPLASEENAAADAMFAAAEAQLAAGDTATARASFVRARDLDVVRFRAPSAFDSVVRHVADDVGAIHVPVADAFAAASPGGIPGASLFLEHVHPTDEGYALLARLYAEAMRESGVLGDDARWERVRPWEEYSAAMAISPFDSLYTHHLVETVRSRWPFRAPSASYDYRGRYQPVDMVDSLALVVSRGGAPWASAKLALGERFMERGDPARAAVEFAGLARATPPVFDEPWRMLGQALLQAGRADAAEAAFVRAGEIRPSPPLSRLLAQAAFARGDTATAIERLESAAGRWPSDPDVQFQLSIAYGLAGRVPDARTAALRASRLRPGHPGLADWLQTLGIGGRP